MCHQLLEHILLGGDERVPGSQAWSKVNEAVRTTPRPCRTSANIYFGLS